MFQANDAMNAMRLDRGKIVDLNVQAVYWLAYILYYVYPYSCSIVHFIHLSCLPIDVKTDRHLTYMSTVPSTLSHDGKSILLLHFSLVPAVVSTL